MSTSSKLESPETGRLAFDCPWCGAILGVDSEHLGTSYPCPECGESTTLTDSNTRQGHLADVSADASAEAAPRGKKKKAKRKRHAWESYEKGHLTFDCPWCGAIFGLASSHLGERFACPECLKETKLTEATTRKSDVSNAAPDAPPHEGARSRLPLVVGAVVVVLAAVVAIVVAAGSGSDGNEEPTPTAAAPRDDATAPSTPPSAEPVAPPADMPADMPADTPADTPADAPEGEPTEGTPPTEEESEPPPAAVEPVPVPEPAVEEGPSELELAQAALTQATKALEDWRKANADAAACLRLHGACGEVCDAIQRLLGDLDPASATVAEARAYNDAVHRFVLESKDRVAVADRLTRHLVAEPLAPLRLRSWESLNFFEPRVRETLRHLHATMLEVNPDEHDALLKKAVAAREAVELAEASDEPEAPPGD